MLAVNSLTNDPTQQFVLNGIPGIQISITLRFMPRIQIWNMDVSWGTFTALGIPVLCSPNLLRQWRRIIPFGIACTDIYKLDPYTVNDFAVGDASFFLLNADDVAAVEDAFFS